MRRVTLALALALAAMGCGDSCGSRRADAVGQGDAAARRVRTPAEIRDAGNALEGQGSLYLRQHAHNPIEWYPWTPETLALAEAEGRPIFVSIGYASCHWCHVMEAEVFTKDDVAEALNRDFVAIKVDREERPDVDAYFMNVVQSLTGSGGWPMTVILTPGRAPVFAGTYLPHDRFLGVLASTLAAIRGAPDGGSQRTAAVAIDDPPVAPDEPLRAEEIHAIVTGALDGIDEERGGFRGRMKFPSAPRWTLLLHAYRKWGDARLGALLRRTLDAMASGGLADAIGGGFFRYTVDPAWTVPHFEKMLYVNAELASLYLEAAATFGEARYRHVATTTLDFLVREMRTSDGAFAASIDADSGAPTKEEEGAYYTFTAGELRRALGDTDGVAFAALVGATEAGNFERGANVVLGRATPADVRRAGIVESEVPRLWERARPKLLALRETRPRPAVDEKAITGWNGLAIAALARGFAATGDERYRAAAARAADRLWTLHHGPAGLARASTRGAVAAAGALDDHALLAGGLLALFEATGDRAMLERALTVIEEALGHFGHPSGGWYATRADPAVGRRVELHDGEDPSGASAMLSVVTRVGLLAGSARHLEAADRAERAFARGAREGRLGTPGLLDAALLARGPFYDVVLAGEGSSLRALGGPLQQLAPAWTVTASVPAGGAPAELVKVAPALAAKISRGGAATAYVCVRGACTSPTSDPAVLRAQLMTGWAF